MKFHIYLWYKSVLHFRGIWSITSVATTMRMLHWWLCYGEGCMVQSKHYGVGWNCLEPEIWICGVTECLTRSRPYIDQVLRTHISIYFVRHQSHVFQQDNARANTARLMMDFRHHNNVQTLPGLNPYQTNSKTSLWASIMAECRRNQISMAFINRQIHYMCRKCRTLQDNH